MHIQYQLIHCTDEILLRSMIVYDMKNDNKGSLKYLFLVIAANAGIQGLVHTS
jgi:hypothetical protein